ncbi:MAG: 3-phosphoshikimate 1-carboxyvinyltransferase [Clostridia bacterium]|nr:3-phosphoshikimate 1-carboxyvinyltransferase [Clostridia bacterium]
MTVRVSGHTLSGKTAIISSKSAVHRLLICAALCDTPTVIEGVTYSEDIEATIACLRAGLADIACEGDRVTVSPRTDRDSNALLDCGESGSTLRFLLPIMAACGGARFTGRGRLSQRPLTPIYPVLEQHSCHLSAEGEFPLSVTGRLQGDVFEINGSLSSQFVSGLLMAAPLLGTTCRIRVTGEMASYPYIALTIEALAKFGVTVVEENATFTVSGNYTSAGTLPAEGDWSNAAFWLTGAALSGSEDFELCGLSVDSRQGDREIVALLEQAGFSVANDDNLWRISGGKHRQPLRVDAEAIPDLVPIVAVLASALSGQTVIYNAERLVHKESNRLQTVHDMLTALGGKVTMTADGLLINGGTLTGGTVQGYNDHRIVMSAAIAALICKEPVTIVGAEAVKKSYPTFFEELEKRGMSVCHLSGDET